MTKQAIIGFIGILILMIAGVFEIITPKDILFGLVGFGIGLYLTNWENNEVV